MKNRQRDKRATVCPVCLQAKKSGRRTKRKKHGDDRASFDVSATANHGYKKG